MVSNNIWTKMRKRLGSRTSMLIIMLSVVGVVYLMTELSRPTMHLGEKAKPLATVVAKVSASSRKDFFSQLRQFANEKKFQISIQKNPHFGESYDIDMRSDDFWVQGDSLFDPLTFELWFLPAPPHRTAPNDAAGMLARDLVRALNQVGAVSATLNE